MTEKNLISKLNNLKNFNPDQNWLKSNRELLLSQISNSGATELSAWKVFVINFQSVVKASSQPAFALGAFVLVLLGGSLFSHQLFNTAKPNDSLYIARIISEKAKLNTMFNFQEREKMAAQFATDHAQDIASTLADPKFDQAANQDQVARLNTSFNEEIAVAKDRISKLNLETKENISVITANPNDQVFKAGENNKDSQGIQLADGRDINATGPVALNIPNTTTASQTLTLNASGTASSTKVQNKDSQSTSQILDEAKKLFDNKDYGKALDKLKEVDEIIRLDAARGQ